MFVKNATMAAIQGESKRHVQRVNYSEDSSTRYELVRLIKQQPDDDLGIYLSGKRSGPGDEMRYVVVKVEPGKIASENNQIRTGDELIHVNDRLLRGIRNLATIQTIINGHKYDEQSGKYIVDIILARNKTGNLNVEQLEGRLKEIEDEEKRQKDEINLKEEQLKLEDIELEERRNENRKDRQKYEVENVEKLEERLREIEDDEKRQKNQNQRHFNEEQLEERLKELEVEERKKNQIDKEILEIENGEVPHDEDLKETCPTKDRRFNSTKDKNMGINKCKDKFGKSNDETKSFLENTLEEPNLTIKAGDITKYARNVKESSPGLLVLKTTKSRKQRRKTLSKRVDVDFVREFSVTEINWSDNENVSNDSVENLIEDSNSSNEVYEVKEYDDDLLHVSEEKKDRNMVENEAVHGENDNLKGIPKLELVHDINCTKNTRNQTGNNENSPGKLKDVEAALQIEKYVTFLNQVDKVNNRNEINDVTEERTLSSPVALEVDAFTITDSTVKEHRENSNEWQNWQNDELQNTQVVGKSDECDSKETKEEIDNASLVNEIPSGQYSTFSNEGSSDIATNSIESKTKATTPEESFIMKMLDRNIDNFMRETKKKLDSLSFSDDDNKSFSEFLARCNLDCKKIYNSPLSSNMKNSGGDNLNETSLSEMNESDSDINESAVKNTMDSSSIKLMETSIGLIQQEIIRKTSLNQDRMYRQDRLSLEDNDCQHDLPTTKDMSFSHVNQRHMEPIEDTFSNCPKKIIETMSTSVCTHQEDLVDGDENLSLLVNCSVSTVDLDLSLDKDSHVPNAIKQVTQIISEKEIDFKESNTENSQDLQSCSQNESKVKNHIEMTISNPSDCKILSNCYKNDTDIVDHVQNDQEPRTSHLSSENLRILVKSTEDPTESCHNSSYHSLASLNYSLEVNCNESALYLNETNICLPEESEPSEALPKQSKEEWKDSMEKIVVNTPCLVAINEDSCIDNKETCL
ncbi:hypothetical protein WDU94_000442 [Cyamophila willieti]